MSIEREFAQVVRDVKEHVLILQEFGVKSLRFDEALRDSAPKAEADVPKLRAGVPAEQSRHIERSSPPVDVIAKPSESFARPPAGSRLSALPSLSNRERPAGDPVIQAALEHGGEMPKLQPGPGPAHTLFGDISKSLPEAGETVVDIRIDIGNCVRCPLHQGRTKIVHTTGNFQADLMFVGEAPGADEDSQGEPFVGRAGQLLNKIIEAIGLQREDVCIGNINRCRPPGNRQPTLAEAHACKPFLLREIAVIRPKAIVVLGNTAMHNLLGTKVGITRMRGHFHDYFGVKVMPTFHPAYLLRDPSKKREVWEDMKKVRDYLDTHR